MHFLSEIKIILLCGGIGSGKSTAAAMLWSSGIPVYDADSKAKALYDQDNGLVEALERRLGTRLRNEDGKFDKSSLAARLFRAEGTADIAATEALLFPCLMEDFRHFISEEAEKSAGKLRYVAMESATVLEKAYFKDFGDYRIVVDAPYELRLLRACRRDGASRQSVEARMAQQPLMNRISAGEPVSGLDAVILNDSTEAELAKRLESALHQLGIITEK